MNNNVVITKDFYTLMIEIELRSSKFIKIVLAIAFSLSLLIPLTGFVLAISINGFNIGLFLGISLVIVIVARPLFKHFMWHSSGKDIFIITENKIIYKPFIKFFKLPPQEFEYNKLEVLFSDRELCKNDRIGKIVFLEGDNKIKSTLKIIEKDFQRIISEEIFK